MSTLENYNTQYIELKNKINFLQLYYSKVSSELSANTRFENKLRKALEQLRKITCQLDCTEYPQVSDTITVVEKYMDCLSAIGKYKQTFLLSKLVNRSEVMREMDSISRCQAEFEIVKNSFGQKYNYQINSQETVEAAILATIKNVERIINEQVDDIKRIAKELVDLEFSVEYKLGHVRKER